MVYNKICRIIFPMAIFLLGLVSSCKQDEGKYVALNFDEIYNITCSIDVKYPETLFKIPKSSFDSINLFFKSKLRCSEIMKGAPFITLHVESKNNRLCHVSFFLVDEDYFIIQCNGELIGKASVKDTRELYCILRNDNQLLQKEFLSISDFSNPPYSLIGLSSW